MVRVDKVLHSSYCTYAVHGNSNRSMGLRKRSFLFLIEY